MNKIEFTTPLSANAMEDEPGIVSIIEDETDLVNDDTAVPDTLPILPLRNMVMFPNIILPINIGRSTSLQLIRQAYKQNAIIGLFTQRDPVTENPQQNDLYTIGTAAIVLKLLEMPDGTTTAIVQGKKRIQLDDILYDEPYLVGKVFVKEEEKIESDDQEYRAIFDSLKEMTTKIIHYTNTPREFSFALKNEPAAASWRP